MKADKWRKSVRKANAIKFFEELMQDLKCGVPWTVAQRYRYNAVAKYLEES